MKTDDFERIQRGARRMQKRLLGAVGDDGVWHGRLSPSALGTALAIAALVLTDSSSRRSLRVDRGLEWLESSEAQNGGWGDCPRSRANVSTTLLVWCAARLAGRSGLEQRAAVWLRHRLGGIEPSTIRTAVLDAYGDDRSFAAPILTLVALTGGLGSEPECWRRVPQLPLELAVLPQRLYRYARMPVVSYALPALIAIGLVRHRRATDGFPGIGRVRDRLTPRLLAILSNAQPTNGGCLEAVPLTSFVVLSLVAAGFGDHAVVRRGRAFLRRTQRMDGSWPIDSELATWLTSLSVEALADGGVELDRDRNRQVVGWLLGQQLRDRHPFTGAAAGGWAWTPLPGGVPDADDTSGALVALARLGAGREVVQRTAPQGLSWLLDLQNTDGGLPTFCRGWGRLPFDRSCPDITAHAVRAMTIWRDAVNSDLRRRLDVGTRRALRYLERSRADDGTWRPLWFGNQWRDDGANPVYGTSRVVAALEGAGGSVAVWLVERGRQGLLRLQNRDGGWGLGSDGASTIEETALAVRALAGSRHARRAALQGARLLIERLRDDVVPAAEPIGLYFANLWYAEELYPLIFASAALGRLAVALDERGNQPSRCAA